MENFLNALNLEQLGVTGILVALLWYQNRELRQDLRDEREYARALSKLYQESTLKTIETMGKLQAAFSALRDGLK